MPTVSIQDRKSIEAAYTEADHASYEDLKAAVRIRQDEKLNSFGLVHGTPKQSSLPDVIETTGKLHVNLHSINIGKGKFFPIRDGALLLDVPVNGSWEEMIARIICRAAPLVKRG